MLERPGQARALMSSANALNNQFINNGPFNIELHSQHEPIVAGYGFGLRSRILGYFVRADWAWGYEDGQVLPYEFYLSLSLDFIIDMITCGTNNESDKNLRIPQVIRKFAMTPVVSNSMGGIKLIGGILTKHGFKRTDQNTCTEISC